MKFTDSCYIGGDELQQIKNETENHSPAEFARTMNGSVTKTPEKPHKITLTVEVEEDHVIANS